MHIILIVISLPFWLFGSIMLLAILFGSVEFKGKPAGPFGRFMTFIISIMLLTIAYILVTVGA